MDPEIPQITNHHTATESILKKDGGVAHAIDIQAGLKIRRLRRARRLTQGALAKKIGVTFQQVQKYEKGITRVGVSRLHAIATALEIDVRTLVSDLPPTTTSEQSSQIIERDAFAVSPEGVRLLDAFRALPPHPRRMTLGAIAALVECIHHPATEIGPDDSLISSQTDRNDELI